MSTRKAAFRPSRPWLAMAWLVACSCAAAASDASNVFALDIEPPPALAIEVPAAQRDLASEAREIPAVGLSPPELPAVVVEVPAAATPPAAAPAQAAEAAAPPPSPARNLAEAIRRRAADPALALPARITARDREGLAAAYLSGEPLWIADGAWTAAAKSVIDRLARAGEDGLDPAEYAVPRLAASEDLADAELKLSAAAFLYARDARGGRLEPNRLGGLITPKLDLPGIERVLATLATGEDAGAALHGFNPRYPGYAALREKLAEIRAERPVAAAPRERGTRVASVGTTASLGRLSPRIEGDIVANMERWRWLPANVADRYVLVNIPEFRLRLLDRGATVHEARVITGTAQTPTPIFSDLVDHAIVNPSWFIPPSIMKKDVLPGLARDPDYATKRGYSVTRRGGATSVRMPPGPRNALGYVKFMFPNDHSVYLHDTPNRGLFGGANRALSHGCVRLDQPFAFGAKVLGPQWSEGRLKSLIGSGERTIRLDERLPIHLAYFTVSVDEDGELRSFGDVYGYHGRVRRALGLGG